MNHNLQTNLPTNDDSTQNIFKALLQLGIGTRTSLTFPHPIPPKIWYQVMNIARKQSVSGILIDGILKLSPTDMPPSDFKMKSIQHLLHIEKLNLQLNRDAVQVSEYLRKDGLTCSILKGQGVARYYPNPLHRIPGDIDVWPDKSPQEIREYGIHKFPNGEFRSHHIDFPIMEHTEVELHFQPGYMYNPITNNRFLRFCRRHRKACATNDVQLEGTDQKVAVTTDSFNRVYILQHIMRHFLEEGIGLRQLMDYCMILRQGMTETEKKETIQELKRLNMKGFAQAVMYVLKTVFSLEDHYLLLNPDPTKGKILLKEIWEGGNFGHHDSRYNKVQNIGYKFLRRIHKNIGLFKLAPSEIIATIGFLPYIFFYRRGYKLYVKLQKRFSKQIENNP